MAIPFDDIFAGLAYLSSLFARPRRPPFPLSGLAGPLHSLRPFRPLHSLHSLHPSPSRRSAAPRLRFAPQKAIGENENLTQLLDQARDEHPLHRMDGLEGTAWDPTNRGD